MLWRELTREEIDFVYKEHMTRDFPPEELPPFPPALQMMDDGEGWFYGIYDGETMAAYVQLLLPGQSRFALLNYFAVLPPYRNGGLGERLLSELPVHLPDVDGILIESEFPDRAADPDMARRRLGFYARSGAENTYWRERIYDAWYYVLLLLSDKRKEGVSA